jgi:FlaA1/EpsC-like NDP-sugar epimerase
MLNQLLNTSRPTKRLISLSYDTVIILACLYLSISLRLGELFIEISPEILACFIATLVTSLIAMIRLGLYRAILRYAQVEAFTTIILTAAISSVALIASSFFFQANIPRSSPLIYFLAHITFLGTPRLLIKNLVQLSNAVDKAHPPKREAIIIYGAGYTGYQLANSLANSTKYKVKAFIDDDKRLWGNKIKGIDVFPPKKVLALSQKYKIDNILLAMENPSRLQKRAIINRLEELNLQVKTVPPVSDIISGKATIEDIKPVSIEDLLGRDPVPSHPELMSACITEKNVMVTGAGGSIGSELCRQIINHNPAKLVLFDVSEFALYQIKETLKTSTKVIATIGNIQDKSHLEESMKYHGIDTIYHAAAYKHVPIIENNISAGVKNNILGTWYCAEAAIRANVSSFVLISTDKAVRPTNVMGATKRVAELILQALAKESNNTRFTMVRFGNVLGSSGSVIPKFKQQIENGGPVTVTHPDIIRYFMTIPEAAELVIQAGAMGTGGDVFVLDMGAPVKIVDLAHKMIHLSGMSIKDENNPDGDITIEISGLRPGEKLYEELLIGENTSGTKHPRIMRAQERSISWKEMSKLLSEFKSENSQAGLLKLLQSAPIDFKASNLINTKPPQNVVKLVN